VFTEFMQAALAGQPPTPFEMPAGMDTQWIDETTGMAAVQDNQKAILEAFKPGTGPNQPTSMIGLGSDTYNAQGIDTAQQEQPPEDVGDPGIADYRDGDRDDNSGGPMLALPPPSLTQNSFAGRGGLF
jgi:hypothetical protein